MATSKDFIEFVREQLRLLEDIKIRPMMGEYLLYYKDKLFGGVYDDRFLIKKTITNQELNLPEEIPYNGAKPMYMVTDIDNAETLKDIVIKTCMGIK